MLKWKEEREIAKEGRDTEKSQRVRKTERVRKGEREREREREGEREGGREREREEGRERERGREGEGRDRKTERKTERENLNCFLLIDDVVAMETPVKKQVENYRLFKLQRNRYAHTLLIIIINEPLPLGVNWGWTQQKMCHSLTSHLNVHFTHQN